MTVWVPGLLEDCAKNRVLGESEESLFFVYNMTLLRETVAGLRDAFPADTLHAFAAKANPLWFVAAELNKLGMGFEAASIGEFAQGISHFAADRVVFDSPCKTVPELTTALQTACHMNLDNFQELDRVAAIRRKLEAAGTPSKSTIGLRINPQLGSGSLALFSTGTAASKFGIPLEEKREEILQAFRDHPWLTMLHVHSGSQGLGLDLLVNGVAKIVELAEGIGAQVATIDIGGGMAADFATDSWVPPYGEYASLLREKCPALFKRRIVTEFGRSVMTKAGALVSRVEYTKEAGGRRIVTQHAGVDVAIRTIWAPKEWPLRVSCYTCDGVEVEQARGGTKHVTDVAGPCCLGGDIMAHQRELPPLEPGDYVVFHDVGAYFHASYSYYNLRQAPALFSYHSDARKLVKEKPMARVEDTLSFMGPPAV
ncbi:Diaminopimelate decarboxylase [Diplonema papillatum]|nr:Diaminopimelate decarboxylase [Diplonema papillatum]|eukprot:gene9138-14163_t